MDPIESTSEIKFTVHLNKEKFPVSIEWHATDAGMADNKKCRALLISLFDEQEEATLKIDLWTKDMMVHDMKRFFAESMMSMGETFFNATNDSELADMIRNFAKEFAKKAEVS